MPRAEGSHQQHPQLRGLVVLAHADDASGALAVHLGDPGRLAPGVVAVHVVGPTTLATNASKSIPQPRVLAVERAVR
ncbi:hypothetical protein GCM10018952_22360 [Streptosporangium vulgare]